MAECPLRPRVCVPTMDGGNLNPAMSGRVVPALGNKQSQVTAHAFVLVPRLFENSDVNVDGRGVAHLTDKEGREMSTRGTGDLFSAERFEPSPGRVLHCLPVGDAAAMVESVAAGAAVRLAMRGADGLEERIASLSGDFEDAGAVLLFGAGGGTGRQVRVLLDDDSCGVRGGGDGGGEIFGRGLVPSAGRTRGAVLAAHRDAYRRCREELRRGGRTLQQGGGDAEVPVVFEETPPPGPVLKKTPSPTPPPIRRKTLPPVTPPPTPPPIRRKTPPPTTSPVTPRPTPIVTPPPTTSPVTPPVTPPPTPAVTPPATPPPPPPPCRSDQKTLKVQVKTDGKPEETSWWLINLCPATPSRTFEIPLFGNGYTNPNHEYTATLCIDNHRAFSFRIDDGGGDGMCSGDCGWYKVMIDDAIVVNGGGQFGTWKFEYFVVGQPAIIDVTVHTDNRPQDTAWYVYDRCTADVPLNSQDYAEPDHEYRTRGCLPGSCRDYQFNIVDANGDGMNEGGYYSVKINDVPTWPTTCRDMLAGNSFTVIDSRDDGVTPFNTERFDVRDQPHQEGDSDVQVFQQCEHQSPATPPPTPAVTPPATPPPPQCHSDQKTLKVQVKTDGKPEETSWRLINLCAATPSYSFETPLVGNGYTNPNHEYTATLCIDNHRAFSFHINDGGGDGMCSGDCGWYTVTIDDAIVVNGGGQFGPDKFEYFVLGQPAIIDVTVHTDDRPQDTAWHVYDRCTADELLNSQNYAEPDHGYWTRGCLASNHSYLFEILDSNHDGINEGGWYMVMINDVSWPYPAGDMLGESFTVASRIANDVVPFEDKKQLSFDVGEGQC